MDLLTLAIGSLRVGRAEARRVSGSGSWGMRYAGLPVSGFHILLRGSGFLITAAGEPHPLKPGDIVLTPFGAEHGFSHTPCPLENLPPAVMSEDHEDPEIRARADVEFLCGAYWLDHGEIHHYLRALPDVIAISPDYDRDMELRSLAELLGADVSGSRPGTETTRPALLDLLLTQILRQWLEQNGDADRSEISDPAIAAALREIHAGPDKPWTVQQLSDVAKMSRTTFTKRFTTAVGKPPMAYVTGWRLTYAARLLRGNSAPLATIARQVGYSTEFAFASAFRREYGIAPGRFRDSPPPRT